MFDLKSVGMPEGARVKNYKAALLRHDIVTAKFPHSASVLN